MTEKMKKTTSAASPEIQGLLRTIPKVDEFLSWVEDSSDAPLRLIKIVIRDILAEMRQAILAGAVVKKGDLAKNSMLAIFDERLRRKRMPNLRTVINATGVVIHTNLGRSVLPVAAVDALTNAALCYSNLEFDLASGQRGSRYSLVEDLLCELTGAEAALVVNNNAAAVLLVLETLAKGREVVVSRGQLVEIGGSFRIPEVMAKSGAKLVEVGATNRTHLWDYEAAIGEETGLLLKVHASNFRVIGFTSEVGLPELLELAKRYDLPVMEDLGSGSLVDLSRFGFVKEPTVQEVVQAGVDVVTFSGDKLLGGPQAGLILGKQKIIDQIKKNQLTRALRIDKFTLAALETVLRLYFDEQNALETIPTLRMLTMPLADIDRRAKRLCRRLQKVEAGNCSITLISTGSRVGGGALPEQNLPSRAVALQPLKITVNELEERLRRGYLPVIGRIEDDRFLMDMRTILDHQVVPLAGQITKALAV